MYLDKRKRYVLYAIVAIVSIVALVIVVFEEVSSKSTPVTTPTPTILASEDGEYKITYSSKNIELINEFNELFKQELIDDGTDVKDYIYSGEDENIKSIITPGKGLTNTTWTNARVDLFLPDLHIGTKTQEAQAFIDFYSEFINGKMINKAREIIRTDESIDTYTGTYGAYVRTVTDSTSKEEIPIFSYMVKTQMHSSRNGENDEAYSLVYDLKNGEKVSLKKMLLIYGINWREIKDAINNCIREANKNLDENVYKRENDEIFYSIDENYNKYVVNEKGDIYVYFCYGNNEDTVTNAIDVIKITNNNYNKNNVKSKLNEENDDELNGNTVSNVDNGVNESSSNESTSNGNDTQNSMAEIGASENSVEGQNIIENVSETQEQTQTQAQEQTQTQTTEKNIETAGTTE